MLIEQKWLGDQLLVISFITTEVTVSESSGINIPKKSNKIDCNSEMIITYTIFKAFNRFLNISQKMVSIQYKMISVVGFRYSGYLETYSNCSENVTIK